MPDRRTKEWKMVALLVGDLEANISEAEMVEIEGEVRALAEEELDRTLTSRLNLAYPPEEEEFERALAAVRDVEINSEKAPEDERPGGFSGAPDLSHRDRPEEHGSSADQES